LCQYKLAISITNGTVLNKLQSYYSRVRKVIVVAIKNSDGYFMSTACGRPQGERGVSLMWTGQRG